METRRYQQLTQVLEEHTTVDEKVSKNAASTTQREKSPLSPSHGTKTRRACPSVTPWTDWWSIEVLTIFLSSACFVSLVVVLMVYDNKPTPRLPFNITFNALVSVLATIIKSSILLVVAAALGQYRWLWLRRYAPQECNLYDIQLLDDASRGPWGALVLLYHLRGRWLVSIGAVATILSLGLEPFVQQIPFFYSQTQLVPSQDATIPRALTWIPADSNSTQGLQPSIDKAIAQGIYNTRSSPLSPSCPMGSCHWEPFQTLAVCHQCTDATNLISANGTCRFSGDSSGIWQDMNTVSRRCDYRIGDKIIAMGTMTTDTNDIYQYDMPSMIIWPSDSALTNPATWTTWNSDKQLGLPGWDNPTFAFYRLTPNTTMVQNGTDAGSPVLNATKCALNFCVQEHEVTVKGNNLDVNTTTLAFANLSSNSPDDRVSWLQNPAVNDVDRVDSRIWLQTGHATSLASTLRLDLQGNVTTPLPALGGSPSGYTSLTMYAMWDARSLEDIMANISLALTQYILDDTKNNNSSSSSPSKDDDQNDTPIVPATGFAEESVTTLRVRWGWLAFPAMVLVLSLVFLTATAYESRRSRVEVWKTSSLPLLYHGLDRQDDRAAVMGRVSEMEEDARGVKVRLAQINLFDQTMGWKMLRRRRVSDF